MERSDTIWKEESLVKVYLEGIRGAIPLASVHIDVMLQLIKASQKELDRFLDIGCGNGVLSSAILGRYPNASATLIDFSDGMLEAAKIKLEGYNKITVAEADFAQKDWIKVVQNNAPFNVIVSGFAIHHQSDQRKREVYKEIHDLLHPGGFFINLEHVASRSSWGEKLFEEHFIDSMCDYQSSRHPEKTREEIAKDYYYRDDKKANILAPVEDQCEWLRKTGFQEVDCYFKLYEIAIFGGCRPV